MKRPHYELLSILILLVVCLGTIAFEAQTKIVRRSIDKILYDNWNHYLPCDQLPTELDVRLVIEEHLETIKAIEQVNPGLVGLEVDTLTCPGKADLVIWYASHENRLAIEAILTGDTFYGIPYRLQNR